MANEKRICIIGFALDAGEKIKTIIETRSVTDDVFVWVGANDKNIHGIVINASFLETPQIQKFMSIVRCPTVCAYTRDEGRQMAEKYHLPGIDLRQDNADTQSWVACLLEGKEPPVNKPVTQQEEHTPKPSREAPVAPKRASSAKVAKGALTYKELLNAINKADSGVFLAECGNAHTWIKPSDNLVFIDYSREQVVGIEQWSLSKCSEASIPSSARQLKLDLWLFETLWQSKIGGDEFINRSAYYRLKRWPQPLSREGRTEALRLAASAQSIPVTVQSLSDKTNYSSETVTRFLFAVVYSGLAQMLRGEMPRPVIQENDVADEPVVDVKVREEKRSLLARLRAKLGL